MGEPLIIWPPGCGNFSGGDSDCHQWYGFDYYYCGGDETIGYWCCPIQ